MAVKLWNTDYTLGSLFRDSSGNIHICGYGNRSASTPVYYAISIDGGSTFKDGEGGGVGTYKQVATCNFPQLLPPDIVVDSSSDVYIFFGDDSENLIFVKKTSGTWGSTSIIGDHARRGVQAEIDDDDNLIIIAHSVTGKYRTCFTSIDGGANWVEEKDESGRAYVDIDLCLGYNQHLWGIFLHESVGVYSTRVNKIIKTEGSPDSWVFNSDDFLTSDTDAVRNVAIVVERDSETVWAFASRKISGQYRIQYKKKTSGVWGSWTDIVVGGTFDYNYLSVVRDYDNNIYVFYYNGTDDLSYIYWNGSIWSSETLIKTDANNPVVEHPNLSSGINTVYYVYGKYSVDEFWFDSFTPPVEFLGADTVNLSDEIFLNLSLEKTELNDIITLSDGILLNLNIEKVQLSDTIDISDSIIIGQHYQAKDIINLSDDIYINLSREEIILNDTITLSDNILDWKDIINDFRIVMGVIEDIPNDFRSVIEVISDTTNIFNMSYAGDLKDIESDIRYVTEPTYDINNDFRMLKSWQIPGDAGFQSLGKEYIKVYINGSADDDVDIDSITIHKVLNESHTANFVIGRPYDTVNKPTIEHEVEIRYYEKNWGNYWLLYKGYITQINPGDDPDSLKVNCQDKYWIRNREKKYFYIGHNPSDEQELYYEWISSGLSICGFSGTGIGNFVPQTMNLFGRGESDSITSLIINAGNYGWFYDVDGTKKLWTADRGSIINLERQELDKNIGLYQVLKHSFTESIENLVNKFRVEMGDKIIRRFNDYGENKEYESYYYHLDTTLTLTPAWDSTYERLASDDYEPASTDAEGNEISQVGTSGIFRHTQEENELYKDVYTKYTIPFVSFIPEGFEAYTDRFEPKVFIHASTSSSMKYSGGEIAPGVFSPVLDEGYTIDYKNNTVTFGERKYFYTEDDDGKINSIRKPITNLRIWKQRFQARTNDPSDDPQNPGDITSPLVFITNKLGDYPETVWGSLQLSGLGIQIGGWTITGYDEEENPIRKYVPSWNDTTFAYDLAYWNLSKTSDKKISGSVDLTIDTICHYEINLAKRIMIDGILENSLNIKSMTYTLNNFTVSLELENDRYYKRTVSIQSRGS